jgi:hypothetical protein
VLQDSYVLERIAVDGNLRTVFDASHEGTDADSQQGYAQVKADTEPALLKIGFPDSYALRPGFIQSMRGGTRRVGSVRWLNALTQPMHPFLSSKAVPQVLISPDLLAAANAACVGRQPEDS